MVGNELALRLRLVAESRRWLPGSPILLESRRPRRGAWALSVLRVEALRVRFEFLAL